jgi:hypothetical protein
MIFFHHHVLTRKEKKKILFKKNQKHIALYNFVRLRLGDEKRVKDLKEVAEKAKKKSAAREQKKRVDKKEIWSVKVSTIRNRLSDRKRTSDDRWNRFAGTEDGGGRGR